MFAAAIHGCSEEVCSRVDARCVDVVVLGEVAHLGKRLSCPEGGRYRSFVSVEALPSDG